KPIADYSLHVGFLSIGPLMSSGMTSNWLAISYGRSRRRCGPVPNDLPATIRTMLFTLGSRVKRRLAEGAQGGNQRTRAVSLSTVGIGPMLERVVAFHLWDARRVEKTQR